MSKHRLVIMRHAKSDWNTNVSKDFDRPLNRRGKNDGPRMAKWLKNNNYIPERVIVSPARRAIQTSRAIAEEIDIRKKAIIEVANIYEASRDDLLSVIDQYSDGIETLMIIGHNPGLEDLCYYLAKDKLPLSDSGKLLTAGAIMVLGYGKHAISCEASSARLEDLVRPRELN